MTLQFFVNQLIPAFKAALTIALATLALTACQGTPLPNDDDGVTTAEGLAAAHSPQDLSQCQTPVDITLNEISDVVDWINAMPKPLTLACFVASLPRPLIYNATVSLFSAQPSVGQHNPRIFVRFGKLWLSYVPQETVAYIDNPDTQTTESIWDADGIQLLELSLEVETDYTDPQSIKAELAFPITKTLAQSAPFAKVSYSRTGTSSVCGSCHASERVIDHIDGIPVFRSAMLRNSLNSEVGHGYLINQYLDCDPNINTSSSELNNEWYRCQMLEATYGFGSMQWESFRADIDQF